MHADKKQKKQTNNYHKEVATTTTKKFSTTVRCSGSRDGLSVSVSPKDV